MNTGEPVIITGTVTDADQDSKMVCVLIDGTRESIWVEAKAVHAIRDLASTLKSMSAAKMMTGPPEDKAIHFKETK